MRLHQFPWGIYPRRLHVYLMEKGITDIEMVELDVIAAENRKPEYLAMNPTGTIPMLETGTGNICQSTSILLYLEERFPAPGMSGATPEQRARIMDLMMLINEAYNFAGICTYYGSPLFVQRRSPSDEIAQAMYVEFCRVMESLEAMAGNADYLGGEDPCIADVAFFASEQFMRTLYKLRLPGSCVKLETIYDRFLKRPSATAPDYPPIVVEHAPVRFQLNTVEYRSDRRRGTVGKISVCWDNRYVDQTGGKDGAHVSFTKVIRKIFCSGLWPKLRTVIYELQKSGVLNRGLGL